MTIDEEISSLIKGMDHDYKRLKGILISYKEKKDDLADLEYDERQKVADLLQESNAMFQMAFQEQTRKFESGQGNQGAYQNVDLDEYLVKVSKKLESLEKQNLIYADSTD